MLHNLRASCALFVCVCVGACFLTSRILIGRLRERRHGRKKTQQSIEHHTTAHHRTPLLGYVLEIYTPVQKSKPIPAYLTVPHCPHLTPSPGHLAVLGSSQTLSGPSPDPLTGPPCPLGPFPTFSGLSTAPCDRGRFMVTHSRRGGRQRDPGSEAMCVGS